MRSTQCMWYRQKQVTFKAHETLISEYQAGEMTRVTTEKESKCEKEGKKKQYLGQCSMPLPVVDKLSTSCLYTPTYILPPSFLSSSAFLLSITHFVRWHFQWEIRMLLRPSSYVKSNSFCNELHFKGRRFFPHAPLTRSTVSPTFKWVMRINSGTEGREETHTRDYFIYEISLFLSPFLSHSRYRHTISLDISF